MPAAAAAQYSTSVTLFVSDAQLIVEVYTETAAIPPILYDMDEKTFLCAFILVVFYVFNFKHFLNVFNNKNVSVNVTQNSRSILMIFCVVYSFTTLCKIDGR